MMIRKILQRASTWAHSLSHFGNLGRVAAQRSFLRKEKKKLQVKLGDKVAEWVKTHPEAPPEVKRIVAQIHKIDELLAKLDFGGEAGVDFKNDGEGPPKSDLKKAKG